MANTYDVSGHAVSSSARWSALRRAFVAAVAASKGRTGDTTASAGQDSRHKPSFEGFKLFPREEQAGLFNGGDILVTYRLPGGSQVKTREAPLDGTSGGRPPITLEQIFSHRIHGVDNTGNVRVWPAEQVLLYALLTGPLASSLSGARVLELGAGKCGLAGLGLAVGSTAAEVVITDGNPEAVENLQACLELNEKEGSFGETKVIARRLMWDHLDKDGAFAELMTPSSFDLVIASDCLFFKESHDDLRRTIAHLLAPRGRAILVQPQRGGTLDLFLHRVASADNEMEKQKDVPPLAARLVRRFDGRVWAMHMDYVKNGGYNGYTPDRHLPLLVELCKSRNSPRGVGSEHDGQSPSVAEEEASTGEESVLWTPWPENLPPVPPIPTALPTETKAVKGREMRGNKAEEVTSAMVAVLGGEQGGIIPSPSHNLNHNPNDPNLSVSGDSERPTVAADPWMSVASVTSKFPSSDRPDRRMEAVYRDLAERLIGKIRDRRASSSKQQQRQQQQKKKEEENERGVVVGGQESQQQQQQQQQQQEGQKQQLWVAVAGAPGSGKSTLAAEVCKLVQEVYPAVCVPMDGFHLYREELDAMPDPMEAYRRRGAHWTFNGERFLQEVAEARKKSWGRFPGFDHAVGDPVENAIQVSPSHEVVIVEGNYLLLKGVHPWGKAIDLFDEVWAIQCSPEVCAERVRKRHMETGLSDTEAWVRVETNDLPNAKLVQDLCPWGDVDVVIQSL